ncbi:MAG: tetratricopeptide repeat protein [Bdellovibrionales bacterium]|nr:tetratricopeptide repeat protein [Bdellovibrionales bacterium]
MALLAFGMGLAAPFIFDDIVFIKNNDWLGLDKISYFFQTFQPTSSQSFIGYRPLTMISLALDHELYGLKPWGFRLTNITLHVFNAFLVYLFVKQTKIFSKRPWGTFFAYVVSALFLVHPIQTSCIFLVWKRSTLLIALGSLLSLYAFGRWYQQRVNTLRYLILGWCGVTVALLSKETALILPLVLVLAALLLWEPQQTKRRRIAFFYVPLLVCFLVHFIVLFGFQAKFVRDNSVALQSYMPNSMQLDRWDYLKTQLIVLWKYVQFSFYPVKLHIFHWIRPVDRFLDGRFIAAFIGLGVILVGCYQNRRRHPYIVFYTLWSFLFLIPSSSFVPLQMIIDEDRLYLPLFSFSIMLGYIFAFLISRFSALRYFWVTCICMLITIYSVHDMARAQEWQDSELLWARNIQDYPKDPRPWLNLAILHSREGHAAKANMLFEQALKLDSDYPSAIHFYAEHLLFNQRLDSAKYYYQKSINKEYLVSDSTMALGIIASQQGHMKDAKLLFEKSLAIRPSNTLAMRNFALFLETQRKYDQALKWLKKALLVAPHEAPTQFLIARMVYEHHRDIKSARALLTQLLKQHPDHELAKQLWLKLDQK